MTIHTLDELAVLAQQGDQVAYKKLLQAIVPNMQKVINRRWWGDKQYKEDILQDTLFAIHTSMHTYDPIRPFLPWANTIAVYQITDFLRRYSKTDTTDSYSFQEEGEFSDTFQYSDKDEAEENEVKDLINHALKSLPPKYEQVVRLLKLEGYTLEEVAKQLNMSVGAVKITAHRGYIKLAKYMQDHQMIDF